MAELAANRINSGWTTVAFGDVVRQVKDKVDPEESGLGRYVAGEHMTTDDLRIRRWGTVGGGYLGPAFHMRFKPGHVLYGSRRTYLRKVAIAEFEGITANTTYVLESSDPEVLLPELLPFIMQTEEFSQHSIRESKGSVNPYVNFSDLAWFRLDLPPIHEQCRMVAALQSTWRHTDSLTQLRERVLRLRESSGIQVFAAGQRHGVTPHEWSAHRDQIRRFDDLVTAAICYGIVQVGSYDENGVPTLAINTLSSPLGPIVHRTAHSIDAAYQRSRVEPGDVLISIKGTIGEVGIVPDGFFGNISRDLARIRFDETAVDPRYFVALYRSPMYRRYVQSRVVGTTRAELSIDTLRKMDVPAPTLEVQRELVSIVEPLDQNLRGLDHRISAARKLGSKVLTNCFSTGRAE